MIKILSRYRFRHTTSIVSIVILLLFGASNRVMSQDAVVVVAKDGDGIYGVLRDNGIPTVTKYIDQFIEINSDKLGKNNALFIGTRYILPTYNRGDEGISKETTKPKEVTKPKEIIKPKEIVKPKEIAKPKQESFDYVARSGDNIKTVLNKHNIRATRANIQIFIDLNRANLGKENTLFIGKRYKFTSEADPKAEVVTKPKPAVVAKQKVTPTEKTTIVYYTARSGDNIKTVLNKHNIESTRANTQKFIDLNRANLGKNFTLFIGKRYRVISTEISTKNSKEVVKEVVKETVKEVAKPTTHTAKRGDNIYSLLKRYNITATQANIESFITINKTKLGKNNTLLTGNIYKIPSISKNSTTSTSSSRTKSPTVKSNVKAIAHKTVPIFGKSYSNVSIIDRKLKGATFYLVGGHGGPDPGAIGKLNGKDIAEDEYAYDVTLRLGRELISHGASVYFITRDPNDGIRDGSFLSLDKDELCYPRSRIPLNQVKRLKQRSAAVNRLYAKSNKKAYHRVIMMHVDARQSKTDIDIFFYYRNKSSKGKKCATTLRDMIRHKYKIAQPNRGYEGTVGARGLHMLNKTHPPAVFIELGNIHHARDRKRIIRAGNRQAIASWLADGLIKDYKQSK